MPSNANYNACEDFFLGFMLEFSFGKVFVYDYRGDRAEWKGAVSIKDGKIVRANVAERNFRLPELTIPQTGDNCRHAIVHGDISRVPWCEGDNIVLLQVTTQDRLPLPQNHNPEIVLTEACGKQLSSPATVILLAMRDREAYRSSSDWPKQLLSLTFEQAKNLAKMSDRGEAREFEKDYHHLLDVILPSSRETRLALQILCEAWLLCNVGKDERSLIYAPVNQVDWFKPFGREPTKDNAEAIIRRAGVTVESNVEKVMKVFCPQDGLNEGVVSACLKVLRSEGQG